MIFNSPFNHKAQVIQPTLLSLCVDNLKNTIKTRRLTSSIKRLLLSWYLRLIWSWGLYTTKYNNSNIEAILSYTLGPSEGRNPKTFAVIHQRQPDNTEAQNMRLKSQAAENTCDQNNQWDWLSNQCRSSLIICNDSNHSSSTSSPLQAGRVYYKKLISLTWLECC